MKIPAEDKGKIRVIVFELDGNNASLQESLRTVGNLLSKSQVVITRPKPPTLSKPADPIENDGTEAGEIEVDAEEMASNPEQPALPNGKKTNRKPVTPKLITDLNFTDGPNPFKTFVAVYNPDTQFDSYLVTAEWLKSHRALDAVSPDHMYTAFRFMGWTMPKDFGVVFRDAKQKDLFTNGDKRNAWKITHIGEERLNKLKAGERKS